MAFSLAFKALNFIVLAPLSAAILSLSLRLWGRPSVGNFDIAAFLLSPLGVTALLAVGCILLASLYFELSGHVRLLTDARVHWWEAFKGSARLFPRLVQLGLIQVAMYLALAAPFLAGIGLAYWWFWSGKDLNGLVLMKPREFWWGIGIAGVIAVAYGIVALWLLLRQLFAVPIVILESTRSLAALRMSAERSRGTVWRSAAVLAAWLIGQGLIAASVFGLLHAVLFSILHRSSGSITTVVLATGVVLTIQTVISVLLNVLSNISVVAVVLALYHRTNPSIALPVARTDGSRELVGRRTDFIGWELACGLLVVAVLVAAGSLSAFHGLTMDEQLEITAHRAGAIAAPENTIAALNQAIIDRADWAEIDVQLTADQKIVVMHDIDLARVGGGNRRVDGASLAEIQSLDVGASFDARFKGERIPTLEQMLAAAGERIRLNIELKPHSKQDAVNLTRRVIEELRQVQMISRCRLCSQSYESLQLARQLEPKLEIGYIEATGVGDSAKLDVDFLMIKNTHATRVFVARATQQGKQVHAWTVNDPNQVAPLLDAGVTNLITDNPALMRTRLDEIRELSVPERLLLCAANEIVR